MSAVISAEEEILTAILAFAFKVMSLSSNHEVTNLRKSTEESSFAIGYKLAHRSTVTKSRTGQAKWMTLLGQNVFSWPRLPLRDFKDALLITIPSAKIASMGSGSFSSTASACLTFLTHTEAPTQEGFGRKVRDELSRLHQSN